MLTEPIIREYLQDSPAFNLLLDNTEQFAEGMVNAMIELTYKEASSLVPALRGGESRIPDVIILHGVIANLMRSEGFKELRNQLQYSDSNLNSVSVFHKQSDYENVALRMKDEFKKLLVDFATADFMNSAWGVNTSNSADYSTLYVFTGNEFFGIFS